ncbi:branched-chain amino acid ABC transporter permease [Roseimicrobium sp. ORNL1]|uniref:branched-chain amino acid ABC transporter permease n=1 Tax=Roseimicrobium sp. ORNL1 TaxID=2711231 RepID=UPI0013E183F3|nr:branched-chain amino acid ABC transporter permease [Roseimicrobium sp. ORNL1]QIF03580.1 branched-chain amino acid ABC transporter permease [Roseimicrobium sp. ORNL1]
MEQFIQQLLNGLFLGAIYALIALGYTMVYGVLRFINFAHGDVFMLGAFAGYYLHKALMPMMSALPAPVSAVVILLLSMLICGVLGIVIELLAYRPLRSRPRLNVLITAIGVSLFLEYTAQYIFGATQRPFPELIPKKTVEGLGGLYVSNTQVIVLVATLLLLLALRFIVMKTKMGLAMRALSLNPTAATLMGVNNSVVISFTFGLGSALAGAGGIFYASLYPSIEPFMGILPGLKAFVAAVLGGIGNIPGAALGGMIIGITETLVAGYSQDIGIPSGYKDGVAFVILILILLFKPSGLLGKVEREKV